MKKRITKKTAIGYGVVGTWKGNGSPLGGMLPKWVNVVDKNEKINRTKEAIKIAAETQRIADFRMDEGVEFWFCKTTIKPIKRVEIPYTDNPFE